MSKKKYIIVTRQKGTPYGRVIESDNEDSAQTEAYNHWLEVAQEEADYKAIELTDDLLERFETGEEDVDDYGLDEDELDG